MSPWTPLAVLGRQGPRVIAAGVFLGLALPPLAALLRPLLVPAIVTPFLVALLRLDAGRLGGLLRRPRDLVPALAVVLFAAPLAVHAAALALPPPEVIHTGLVLTAGCAPLMASGALALMLGLDAALAVAITVIATALVPFTLPPLAQGLLGLELDIAIGAFMTRLALLVGGSFAVAWLLRKKLSATFLVARRQELDGISVLGLVVFAIAIMDGVSVLALERPGFVLGCLLAATLLNAGLQAAATLAFLASGPQRALTLGLVNGNNNMGLMLAALADRAPFELVVFVAMAQFPIYLLPVVQRPLYRRLLARSVGGSGGV